MDEYIINSFLFKQINYIEDILKYTINHSNNLCTSTNSIKKDIARLIRTDIIIAAGSGFILTDKGQAILETNTIFYKRIILRFFTKRINSRKYIEQLELRKKRLEQQTLRNTLIQTKEHKCIICDKYLPLYLLEAAHLKPRNILNSNILHNINVVELMCLYCHKLYDNGIIGVTNGILQISSELFADFDLSYPNNKNISTYNSQNAAFFEFHFKTIFKP